MCIFSAQGKAFIEDIANVKSTSLLGQSGIYLVHDALFKLFTVQHRSNNVFPGTVSAFRKYSAPWLIV